MSIVLEILAGRNIKDACTEAIKLANRKKTDVEFDFNGIKVIARPKDSAQSLADQWDADYEAKAKAYRESPEYKQRQERDAEELRRKTSAVMRETARSEKEMREAKDVWPYTEKQLLEYIQSLTDRKHDYGTCVYALSLAAMAAFNFVAHKLGVTGFQSSCADLDFLRRTRNLRGPFMIVKADDMLYPQHDSPIKKVGQPMADWRPWLRKEAKKMLVTHDGAAPGVIAHWKKLAASK